MKIKDVIKKVATMLQLNNVAEADFEEEATTEEVLDVTEESEAEETSTEESDNSTFDTQTQKDINLIISCINSVLCDIATDYLTLKNTETITVQSGEFDLSNLTKSFHKLVCLNTPKNYYIKNNVLYVESGQYEITYCYIPEEYDFDDVIEDFSGKLTIYALCFGVAAEYCLVCGNYSESEMWNSRFESSMQTAKRSVKIPSIKGRKWL